METSRFVDTVHSGQRLWCSKSVYVRVEGLDLVGRIENAQMNGMTSEATKAGWVICASSRAKAEAVSWTQPHVPEHPDSLAHLPRK